MGPWRSLPPTSSRPSAASIDRHHCCPRGPTTTRRSSTGSTSTSCAATGSPSPAQRSVPEPGSFLVRDVLGESVILVRGRDDEIRAFYNVCRHRGTAVEERDVRQGRPLPVPLPRLDLRPRRQPRAGQAHRRPRGLHPRHLRPRPHPLRDLAGLRVPVLRRRVGDAAAEAQLGDLVREPGPVRLHEPSVARSRSCTRSAPTGSSSPRTTASATTARASIPSSTSSRPYDLGRRLRAQRRVAGRLDGAGRGRRDDGPRRRPRLARRPAADVRDHDRGRAADLLLRPVADDVPVDPPRLPARPPAGARSTRATRRSICDWLFEADTIACRGLRPVRRDRVLGPHQPAGLARVRAPAARHLVAQLGRRPLLERGGVGPGVRPDGRRPLRRGRRRQPARRSASATTCPPPKPGHGRTGRTGTPGRTRSGRSCARRRRARATRRRQTPGDAGPLRSSAAQAARAARR